MGLMGLYIGKVTQVRKKLVGSAVFLKLVRALVLSDPACAENRVGRPGHPGQGVCGGGNGGGGLQHDLCFMIYEKHKSYIIFVMYIYFHSEVGAGKEG